MQHLIVGAGATLAEAIQQEAGPDHLPPLIRNFASRTWPTHYNPHPVLEAHLRELGHHELGEDPRQLFYQLEGQGATNIERFLEFAWIHRNKEWKVDDNAAPPDYISGLRLVIGGDGSDITPIPDHAPQWWSDFLYNGIGRPLAFIMLQCFFLNGIGWRDLQLTRSVAARLSPGDLVLNLNYDTVFELSLRQINKPFVYCPNQDTGREVLVCKPHGSLNMVMTADSFAFGQPEWLGMPEPRHARSYSGFIAPRLSKTYDQHWAAEMILAPAKGRRPDEITMWGVGLTESDVELLALYGTWSKHVQRFNVINPSDNVAQKASELLGRDITWFASVEDWSRAH